MWRSVGEFCSSSGGPARRGLNTNVCHTILLSWDIQRIDTSRGLEWSAFVRYWSVILRWRYFNIKDDPDRCVWAVSDDNNVCNFRYVRHIPIAEQNVFNERCQWYWRFYLHSQSPTPTSHPMFPTQQMSTTSETFLQQYVVYVRLSCLNCEPRLQLHADWEHQRHSPRHSSPASTQAYCYKFRYSNI